MTEPRVTYYALLGGGRTADNPSGMVRRTHTDPPVDEAFHRDMKWHRSEYLARYYRRGTTDIDHEKISEDAANAILDRWRAKWTQEDLGQSGESPASGE
ncbi:hypothetical protein [Mycobacterium talmoniae]|uniref:Uncharacterized protein n=1 Tax=Mycobacterium talmoniae TaxID=1858794 RepID=A0A1S1NG42_9MYCO|nr:MULTISPECIES: hypothetical protein [Mycobacterium]OHV04670.1 hypothetical protein BKN37_08860 [Mycobacterium talmoniae]PQM45295.1 hypothetical protein C1Y40_04552 [Mycobacterium talmoniae]TDH49299.1 hypothetical protein E2F47_21040 [Mycobacterium eburneum]